MSSQETEPRKSFDGRRGRSREPRMAKMLSDRRRKFGGSRGPLHPETLSCDSRCLSPSSRSPPCSCTLPGVSSPEAPLLAFALFLPCPHCRTPPLSKSSLIFPSPRLLGLFEEDHGGLRKVTPIILHGVVSPDQRPSEAPLPDGGEVDIFPRARMNIPGEELRWFLAFFRVRMVTNFLLVLNERNKGEHLFGPSLERICRKALLPFGPHPDLQRSRLAASG